MSNVSDAYIDTGVDQLGEIEVTSEFRSDNNTGNHCLFGSRLGAGLSTFAFLSSFSTENRDTKYRTDYGSLTEVIPSSIDMNKHIIRKLNNLTYLDGVLVNTISSAAPTAQFPIYVFAMNANIAANNFFRGAVYSFKIRKSGVLVQNLVPVRRKSDSEYGMWDTVTEMFFGNSGSGKFGGGDDLFE